MTWSAPTARTASALRGGGVRRRDHVGAEALRKLDRVLADDAACSDDEDVLTGLEIAVVDEGLRPGQRRGRQGRRVRDESVGRVSEHLRAAPPRSARHRTSS